MAKKAKCPKCGSTNVGTIIVDGTMESGNFGEFLLCNSCNHQWRPPEDLSDDEFVKVLQGDERIVMP